MNRSAWMAIGVSALALAGCGHKTETTVTNATTDTVVSDNVSAPAASPGQQFANTAAASDAFEIATSRLAAAQAQSAAVKKFASSMIAAHTDSTAKLNAAAGGASPALTPDPTLTAEQQHSVDTLTALHGADFDRAYAAAQVDAHDKALAGLKDYAAGGDVPQLKDFAATLVPAVTAHLNMAKALKP